MPGVPLNHTRSEALTEMLRQGRNEPIVVKYRGRTVNTTKTELFIDGLDAYRLVPPLGSTLVIDKWCLCWNITDGVAGTNTPEIARDSIAQRSAANTVTVTQANVHTICDIEADDTNKRIGVFVTGGDATDTLEWEVTLTIRCMSSEESRDRTFFAFDGKQK